METISGSDFISDGELMTKPEIYKRYCLCRVGKKMREEAVQKGEREWFINLWK